MHSALAADCFIRLMDVIVALLLHRADELLPDQVLPDEEHGLAQLHPFTEHLEAFGGHRPVRAGI